MQARTYIHRTMWRLRQEDIKFKACLRHLSECKISLDNLMKPSVKMKNLKSNALNV